MSNWSSFVVAPSEMCNLFRSRGALPVPDVYPPTGEPVLGACVRTLAADELPCSERMERYVHEYYPNYANFRALRWREAVRPYSLPEAMDSRGSGAGGRADADLRGRPTAEVVDLLFGRAPPGPIRLDPRESIPARLKIEEVGWLAGSSRRMSAERSSRTRTAASSSLLTAGTWDWRRTRRGPGTRSGRALAAMSRSC
jgi:hypothetical protein